MKFLMGLTIVFLSALNCLAQKSDSTSTRYWFYRGLSTHQTELKSKRGVKNGEYKVLDGVKVLATGNYKDNERVGNWRFFNKKDSVEQVYNYTTKKIVYNLPLPNVNVEIDSLKDDDKVVFPIKIGGSFGLYFLLRNLSKNEAFGFCHSKSCLIDFVFTLDVNGKLTKYEIRGKTRTADYQMEIPLKKLKPEDFDFIPAKVNGKYVACKMIVSSMLTTSSPQ